MGGGKLTEKAPRPTPISAISTSLGCVGCVGCVGCRRVREICHMFFLFCRVKTMWLASRKPLSVREHSRFPFLVSRLTLDFCYTFVHIPTTHLLLSVATHFTTLWHTFTRDMSYALTTHLSCCTLIQACPWLRQSLAHSGKHDYELEK